MNACSECHKHPISHSINNLSKRQRIFLVVRMAFYSKRCTTGISWKPAKRRSKKPINFAFTQSCITNALNAEYFVHNWLLFGTKSINMCSIQKSLLIVSFLKYFLLCNKKSRFDFADELKVGYVRYKHLTQITIKVQLFWRLSYEM